MIVTTVFRGNRLDHNSPHIYSDFPSKYTATNMARIPIIERKSGNSLKNTALKTVAAIGSTILKADAVPADKCFIDQVKR